MRTDGTGRAGGHHRPGERGYLTRTRHGRRNHYRVARHTHFRHPAEAQHEISGFLEMFADLSPPTGTDGTPDGRPDDRHGHRHDRDRDY
ncbi:hypothetical protein ACFQ1I_41035 [Kitasatospora arboriphila]